MDEDLQLNPAMGEPAYCIIKTPKLQSKFSKGNYPLQKTHSVHILLTEHGHNVWI